MKSVIIIQSKYCKQYLNVNEFPNDENNKFIQTESDQENAKILIDCGFIEVKYKNKDNDLSSIFLKEYIELVGSIGGTINNTFFWWSTDISSKNRFTSNLPNLLYRFNSIIDIIEREKFDRLLICNPDHSLIQSIRKYCRLKNINFKIYSKPVSRILKTFASIFSRKYLLIGSAKNILKMKLVSQFILRNKIKRIFSSQKNYYIIRSFIYNHSFRDKRYCDSFFGPLPGFLRQRGHDVLIFPMILGDYKLCVKNIRDCDDYPIIPLDYIISFADIFICLVKLLFKRIRCKGELLFFENDVSDIVNAEFERTANGIELYQLLHYNATRRLLRRVKANTFAITYENNPWEKMCMIAAREATPGIKIIGYQHTVVPQSSANMFISDREAGVIPLPDKILTVGEIPKVIIKEYSTYKKLNIHASAALRFEYLFKLPRKERTKKGEVLVVLEGIIDVCPMVDYVLREIGNDKRYNITFRTHPVLPFDTIKKSINSNLESISNVSISKSVFVKDDIEKADIVIYWGSTVALEALMIGVPIINYNMGTILNYDPLFKCNHFKWSVDDDTKLAPVLEEIYEMKDADFNREQANARQYLDRYFYKISDKALSQFIIN